MTNNNENAKAVPPVTDDADQKYEVGYGKPPKANQFKPGQSGNPKGKRKRPKTPADLTEKLLQQKVEVNVGRRKKRLPLIEVVVRAHISRAAKGDPVSTRLILELLKPDQERTADTTGTILSEVDGNELLEAFMEHMGQGTPTIDGDE